jgi:hypothetical protein
MKSGALALTLTDSTSGGKLQGSSGVVRAAVCGEGSGAKLAPASPWCAIAESASDPTLRTVQGGTAGQSCEEAEFTYLSPFPALHVIVRRDSTQSRSFVLAALRALHRDGAFAAGVVGSAIGKGPRCVALLDV